MTTVGSPSILSIYVVAGMTCGHCELSIREQIAELDGVLEVSADHTTGHVTVTSSAPLDIAAVAVAVEEAGYSIR